MTNTPIYPRRESTLPPAEGAEEILRKYWIFSIDNPDTQKQCIIEAMNEFAALHAQKIADKMVSERLRTELNLFATFFNEQGSAYITFNLIIEYLKSRER